MLKTKSTACFLSRKNLVFAIVPAFLLLFMLFLLTEIHAFYQVWLDPVYAYLMNGLTFALGSNDIGHIDHPGTPLQLLVALLIRFLYIFGQSHDLATDVLTHPESYLHFISIVLIAFNCLALWLVGVAANRFIKNRSLAVIVQLAPLLVFQVVNFMPIVACETVVVFSSLAIVSGLLLHEMPEERKGFWLVWIAFFSALMVATKISTAVMLILPFLFFANNMQRIKFTFLILILAILFVLPVWEKLSNLTGFLAKMATHTGQYGSGEAKWFDATIYLRSLGQMIAKEWTFALHVLLIPVGWLVIFRRKLKGQMPRIYLALSVATLLQMAVVARHYSFHYLMPVFAMAMPLHLLFWLKIFQMKIESWSLRMVAFSAMILVAGVFGRLFVMNHFSAGIVNPVNRTSAAVRTQIQGTHIIISDYKNGFALPEPALRFGLAYCGPAAKAKYAPILAAHYSGNYYWNQREGFSDWNGNRLGGDVFAGHEKVYLYANTSGCGISLQKIDEMIGLSGVSGFLTNREVFRNEQSGEVIVEAEVDTAQLRKLNHPVLALEANMEELTDDHIFFRTNNPDFAIRVGGMWSDKKARSGVHSLLLTQSAQFGGNILIPVKLGRRFKLEFLQRSTDGEQALAVASASKSDVFYKTSAPAQNNPEGWARAELNVSLPVDFQEEALNFYFYNPASDSVWIDDISLKVFE
jgi:hypothetical protein